MNRLVVFALVLAVAPPAGVAAPPFIRDPAAGGAAGVPLDPGTAPSRGVVVTTSRTVRIEP